jgi:hypothetical protein
VKLTVHGNSTDDILTQITYSNLKDELLAVVCGLNGVVDGRELLAGELHCKMANIMSAVDSLMDLGLIAMDLVMDWVQGKDFREVPVPSGVDNTYRQRRHQ